VLKPRFHLLGQIDGGSLHAIHCAIHCAIRLEWGSRPRNPRIIKQNNCLTVILHCSSLSP
jgi:hypothetical protein